MIRDMASDGDKRVVFHHYDNSSFGIFIFAINVPPFTYDQTVLFPKHPSHLINFTQDFGFQYSKSSIAYVCARGTVGIIYRYDINNYTKLDFGTLKYGLLKINMHPKFDFAFADGQLKPWTTFLTNSVAYSTLSICNNIDITITHRYGGIMLPDDPHFISSTQLKKLTIYEYVNFTLIDEITVPQHTVNTGYFVENIKKLDGINAFIAFGPYIETLIEYTPTKLTVKFSISNLYIKTFREFNFIQNRIILKGGYDDYVIAVSDAPKWYFPCHKSCKSEKCNDNFPS